MEKITRIFSGMSPCSSGRVWWLEWDDGRKEFTIDAASGLYRFRLVDELRMRHKDLSDKLKARYARMTA